jgi:ech hydrogenase subunit D
MMDSQKIIPIEVSDMIPLVIGYQHSGYRLAQMCATTLKDCLELSYSFALPGDFQSLRMHISSDTEMQSIQPIFPAAFLYENEMHDLFGIKFNHMTVDYDGGLYRTSIKTPFNPKIEKIQEGGEL